MNALLARHSRAWLAAAPVNRGFQQSLFVAPPAIEADLRRRLLTEAAPAR